MRYAHLPLLQVCLMFILGIWFGFNDYNIQFSTYLVSTLVVFIFFLISFWIAKANSRLKLFFTVTSLLLLFSLGAINTVLSLPGYQDNHYSHHLPEDEQRDDFITFKGEIIKSLKSSAFKDKFEVKLSHINEKSVKGRVLLQIPVNGESTLVPNSKIYGIGKIESFENPQNPQQFNYREYMFSQEMTHVIESKADLLQIEKLSGFSFMSLGEEARNEIQDSLEDHAFSEEQLDIIQALLLGQKQNVDPETYDSFSKAGVVHILAVSGLHVGIILLILQLITTGFLRLQYGRTIRSVVVLLGIWGFATLAGYSPSVLRAAVMFSFLSLALNYRRKTSAINTLALSAIFLLLINPYFILQVGFQLSYLAVISIVTLQPRLSKLYEPKYFIDRKIWDIVTVTFTAQLGILPLSLYYFHQFPGLFLLSNLVILPGLGIILSGGILVIILSLLDVLPDFLIKLYGELLDLLLSFVKWIASKEDFIYSEIYFTRPILIVSLVFLFSIFLWSKREKFRSYSILNLTLLALFICIYIEKRNQYQQEEKIVFQTYRDSQFGILKGTHLNLYSDKLQPADSIKSSYHLKNYRVLKGIDTIQLSSFRNVYQINSKEILFTLDSIPVYPGANFNPEYILLKNSPDINLERVLMELQPKLVIADGSNYKTDIDRWQDSAEKFNVKFHSTWEDGAFIFPED